MAVVARYLIDTSAAARIHHEGVAERLAPLITAGLVATCAPLDFEALFSARGAQDYEQIRTDRRAAYEYLPVLDEHWQRAMDVAWRHRLTLREASNESCTTGPGAQSHSTHRGRAPRTGDRRILTAIGRAPAAGKLTTRSIRPARTSARDHWTGPLIQLDILPAVNGQDSNCYATLGGRAC